MNIFIYKIAIIFTPGIIARVFLDRLLFYKHKGNFYFLIHSFLLGVLSYIMLYIVQALLNKLCPNFQVHDVASIILNPDGDFSVNVDTVIYATLMTIPLVWIISIVEKNKYISKFFMKLGATSRFAEPDVWSYLFNSEQFYKNSWVNIRDKKKDLVYQGAVTAFSDTYDKPELLLTDVIVYSNSNMNCALYQVKALYLALTPGDIEIECLLNVEQIK